MKKDIFNGKVLREFRRFTAFTIIFVTVVLFAMGALFITLAFIENGVVRIALFCISGVIFISAVTFPVITLYMIRIYPKHRKVTKIFIREYVFREYDDEKERQIYKN